MLRPWIRKIWLKILSLLGFIKVEIKVKNRYNGMFRKKIRHNRDNFRMHREAEFKQDRLQSMIMEREKEREYVG